MPNTITVAILGHLFPTLSKSELELVAVAESLADPEAKSRKRPESESKAGPRPKLRPALRSKTNAETGPDGISKYDRNISSLSSFSNRPRLSRPPQSFHFNSGGLDFKLPALAQCRSGLLTAAATDVKTT
ncbi:hypothetical protein EVAR_68282_1 [Eumeta japonica]|uniref:Uncharacterized protein n=1 Tax=Eumeta variegata TaxID=151549 RepID=A0A4C1ZVD4_EUMVA|nr:hypothetical protein EVAR_68282_1 [Eumeta japonica]